MADRFNILDKPSKAPAASTSVSGATYADRKTRSAGSLTLNSTTWADVDNNLDITLPAKAGDWVEVGFSALWEDQVTPGYLDVVTLVSGSPVRSFGSGTTPSNTHTGILGWAGVGGVYSSVAGSVLLSVGSGDIADGEVVLRLRYRTATAGDRVLLSSADVPSVFWARNLG